MNNKSAKAVFATRLRQAMTDAGLEPRAAVLERGFNQHFYGKPMTLHGVARWLKGETVPPYPKVVALAKWLKVPVENLFGAAKALRLEESRPRWGQEVGYHERELFEAFLNLPAPQRRVVREVILAFVAAQTATLTAR
jgi:transcriptional regulator with XRE-family HTH domain